MSKYYVDKDHIISLTSYCRNTNIPYNNVVQELYKMERIPKFMAMKDYERVQEALKKVTQGNFTISELYNYIIELCKESRVDSLVVLRYLERNKDNRPESSNDFINDALKYASDYKYYLNGIAVDEICDNNGYDKRKVNHNIDVEIEKNPKAPKEYSINKVLELEKIESKIEYMIDGVPLIDKCRAIDINHMLVIMEYKKNFGDEKPINEEGLKAAFDKVRRKPTRSMKNTIYGMPLSFYCSENGISYGTVTNYIYGIRLVDKVSTDEEVSVMAIDKTKYIKENNIDVKPDVFTAMKYIDDPSFTQYYSKILNIDFSRVYDLKNAGYTFNQALCIIWFFGDMRDDRTKTIGISDSMLYRKVGAASNSIKNNKISLFDIPLLIGYRLYKCDLISREQLLHILSYKGDFVEKLVVEACTELKITPDDDTMSILKLEGKYYLMNAIEGCFFRTDNKINQFISNYIKNRVKDYINKYESGPITKVYKPVE